MKPGTESKLKFKQLKRRMKLPHWQIIGVLETLWRVTESNTPAGNIGKLTDEEIAAAFEWDGDASELVAALIDCKWIDKDDEFRLVIHDWSIHCPNHLKGAFAKNNILMADVAIQQRARQPAKHIARQDIEQPARHSATLPNLSVPNLSVPSLSDSCGETDEPSSPPAVLVFPCDGSPEQWSLTQEQADEWSGLYPSLDITAESRGALAWVLADPTRNKTANGMKRFLVGWFGRAQNRGNGRTKPPPQREKIRLPE